MASPGFKTPTYDLGAGVLDARSSAGTAEPGAFRVLLNLGTDDETGRRRLGGWKQLGYEDAGDSNDDLHDQLLAAQGELVGDVFTPIVGQREAISLIYEAVSFAGSRYLIAATRSRIYSATGQGRNWRLIADAVRGPLKTGQSPWPQHRFEVAQVGDYLFFSDGETYVLYWPLGGTIPADGIYADRMWSAQAVPELLALDIFRADAICGWNGWLFVGVGSVLYWSDGNNPLGFLPGAERLSGFYDFGSERIRKIAPLGGRVRIYTDAAIYELQSAGVDVVWLPIEMSRTEFMIAYPESFLNMGDTHMWLTQDTLAIMQASDREPRVLNWMHLASGFIFNGMDARLLRQLRIPFTAFGALDRTRCHQIAVGFVADVENQTGDIWLSWPTTSVDLDDPEGIRRMTLLLNIHTSKASLVDHGFSAFGMAVLPRAKTVRDFEIEQQICDPDDLLTDALLLAAKEGYPLNEVPSPELDPPTSIWNATEDPSLPMDPDTSLASRVCGPYLDEVCSVCRGNVRKFLMASARDYTIKEYTRSLGERDVYRLSLDTVHVPSDTTGFPNVLQGVFTQEGYATLIQSEALQLGGPIDKLVNRIGIEFDAEDQDPAGLCHVELGMSNTAQQLDWAKSDAKKMDDMRNGTPDPVELHDPRPAAPVGFPFHRVGIWTAFRVFVSDASLNLKPKNCMATFNRAMISIKARSSTWLKP